MKNAEMIEKVEDLEQAVRYLERDIERLKELQSLILARLECQFGILI